MRPALWIRRLPWSIVVCATLLIGLGWVGIARVDELTDGGGRFLHQQVAYSVLAFAAMLAATLPNYRVLCRFSYALFLISLRFWRRCIFAPRSTTPIAGFAWGRSDCSRRNLPRWHSCWRWHNT